MYRKRMSEALKEAREYRDPTCPICEGEGCQCPGEETIEEGFDGFKMRCGFQAFEKDISRVKEVFNFINEYIV